MAESTREVTTRWSFKVDKSQLKGATDAVSKMRSRLKLLGGALALVQTGVIAFAVKQAGEFEQAQIAFETMLKSTSKAKTLLEDITKFAATTPFELPGLIQSSKKLLAFGISAGEIIPIMRNLGNIAAGVGTDKLPSLILAFGKIKTKGKATMEELNILLEAGVPILDQLATNLGVGKQEIFKLVSAGKVGFKEVNEAIVGLGSGAGQFAGLMEKQAKSMFGIFSNIQDTLTILARDIGNEILPIVKELSKDLLNFLEENREGFISFSKALVFSVKNVIDVLGGFSGILKVVKVALFSIIAQQVISRFGRAMRVMRVSLKLLARSFKRAGTAATIAQIKMLLLPIAIGLAAEDIIAFAQGKKSVLGLLIGAFRLLGDILEKELKLDFLNTIIDATSDMVELIREIKSLSAGGIFGKIAKISGKAAVGVADVSTAPLRGALGALGINIPSLNQNINTVFNIKSTDPVKAAKESEQRFKESMDGLLRKEGKSVRSRPQLSPAVATQ